MTLPLRTLVPMISQLATRILREARSTRLRVGVALLALQQPALAQQPSLCVPGTPWCARTDANGRIRVDGQAQGHAGPSGAGANASGNAQAGGNADAGGSGRAGGSGYVDGGAGGNDSSEPPQQDTYPLRSSGYGSSSADVGVGLALCGTVKAGVYSGVKGGPCFGVSFRTEDVGFEMETQLLFGGVRESVDWVFPMSFIIPLTWESSLYEGLHLRVGGSPLGVTFADEDSGGNYLRFGLHTGLSYEWDVSDAVSWRVFDARAFLDFGTKREVDRRGNFLDFGGQLSTGVVF